MPYGYKLRQRLVALLAAREGAFSQTGSGQKQKAFIEMLNDDNYWVILPKERKE